MIVQELIDQLQALSTKDKNKALNVVLVDQQYEGDNLISSESVYGLTTKVVPGKFTVELEGIVVYLNGQ